MNKQTRKEQAIKYLQQLDIYKPYIDGFEKHDHVCVFERFAGFWVYQYPKSCKSLKYAYVVFFLKTVDIRLVDIKLL